MTLLLVSCSYYGSLGSDKAVAQAIRAEANVGRRDPIEGLRDEADVAPRREAR
jgi:hypothetical protein